VVGTQLAPVAQEIIAHLASQAPLVALQLSLGAHPRTTQVGRHSPAWQA
jgi:hypothetical protein